MTPMLAEISDKMLPIEGWLAFNLLAGIVLVSRQLALARFVRWLRLLPALLACWWAWGISGEMLYDRFLTEAIFHEMGSLYAFEATFLGFGPALVLVLLMLLMRQRFVSHSTLRTPHSALR
jgi:hypothetical protein